MSGKKRIIILAVLGIGSFAASFGLSTRLHKPEAPAGAVQASQPGETSILPPELIAGTLSELSPRAQQTESLVQELRSKIDEYSRRDRQLLGRERRLEMTQEILEQQIREIERLQIQLAAAIGPLKDAKAALESTRINVTRQEEEKFREMAAKYDVMDATEASLTIAAMCETEQIFDAAKLLLYMSERQSAKLMAAMPDKTLVAKLTDLMMRVVEQPAN